MKNCLVQFTVDDVEKFLEAEENKNTCRKADSVVALVNCVNLFFNLQ